MIYVFYLLVAAIVTTLSVKAAQYVDMIDKSTNLSGAFIGGVMLAAVTSLPELFTSISSVVWLDSPGLCIGNILGSDFFDVLIIGVLSMFVIRDLKNAVISNAQFKLTVIVIIIYAFMILNFFGILNIQIAHINITSIIILLLYIASVRFTMEDNGEESESDEEISLSLGQIVFRFVISSIGLIFFSIVITYITDIIADEEHLNLGAGLAGALFLGIATSLPELASSVSLFKMKNYNIAAGNIIGSCVFNFLILFIADALYFGGKAIYDFSDPKTVNLLFFGVLATILFGVYLKFRKTWVRVAVSLGIIACYAAFLII